MGWLKGGRVERLATAALLCDYVLTAAISRVPLPLVQEVATAVEGLTMLVFLWLAFTCDRWWLLAASASLVLCVLVGVIGFVHPSVSYYAAASAQVGLWMVVYFALIAGVGERWLAGEQPARATAIWRRRRAAP